MKKETPDSNRMQEQGVFYSAEAQRAGWRDNQVGLGFVLLLSLWNGIPEPLQGTGIVNCC